MIVLSRATQRTAIHEARLIMRSLEVLGGAGACSCSSSRSSRGCLAFMSAFPGSFWFLMDGVGEDLRVDDVEPSSLSFISCPRVSITMMIVDCKDDPP